MILYPSRRAMSQRDKVNIRVWRSLVSRLNGVQEAAGSNPVTRTKKWELPFGNSHFLFCGWIRTHLNATVRWTVARSRLDGIDTIIFLPQREEKCKSNPSLGYPERGTSIVSNKHIKTERALALSVFIFLMADSNPLKCDSPPDCRSIPSHG